MVLQINSWNVLRGINKHNLHLPRDPSRAHWPRLYRSYWTRQHTHQCFTTRYYSIFTHIWVFIWLRAPYVVGADIKCIVFNVLPLSQTQTFNSKIKSQSWKYYYMLKNKKTILNKEWKKHKTFQYYYFLGEIIYSFINYYF